jgi:hypothetical protein
MANPARQRAAEPATHPVPDHISGETRADRHTEDLAKRTSGTPGLRKPADDDERRVGRHGQADLFQENRCKQEHVRVLFETYSYEVKEIVHEVVSTKVVVSSQW